MVVTRLHASPISPFGLQVLGDAMAAYYGDVNARGGTWNGKLVCDDFAGYKASFELGITEIGCMAHARRKFFDLHVANKSQLAEQALHSTSGLCEVERHAKEMSDEDRWRLRQETAMPITEKLHEWMLAQRELVPEGSATAKALDYSTIDNNQIENLIRPWALGRSNWLCAGSLRSGKRAAEIYEPDPVGAAEWS